MILIAAFRFHLLIGFLLRRCERLIAHLQLHGLQNVSSLAEPENQIIAGIHTFSAVARLRIKSGQFIGPSLRILPLPVFFKNINLRFQRRVCRSVQLILKNTAGTVILRGLRVFLEIPVRLPDLIQLQAYLDKPVQNAPSNGSSLISQKENLLLRAVLPVHLIYIGDHIQRIQTLDASPVHFIADLERLLVVLVVDGIRQLIQFLTIFFSVHRVSLILPL